MAHWMMSGRCQCFELVSGWCQRFFCPVSLLMSFTDVFMYSCFSGDVIVVRAHLSFVCPGSAVPGEEKIFSLSPG